MFVVCQALVKPDVQANDVDIVPRPTSVVSAPGEFMLTEQTVIVARPGTESEAEHLASTLRTPTGFALPVRSVGDAPCITLQLDLALKTNLGEEGYRLAVTPHQVVIQAATPAGLFYGGVTLRQLLPAEVCSAKPIPSTAIDWKLPCVTVEDVPRFAWRGLLLDVARHFLPVDFVKRYIDLAALHKFNRLQLHLTDDQGWRVEIKRYPRLTEIGSVRAESPLAGDRARGDGTPYGPFFYTQEQVRELVAYAVVRHVTLVPEIELPGHFLAALTAYPELSCTGGPFHVRTQWGIEPDVLCPGNDQAIEFATNVLAEITELFPSPFIHIGGDEAPRDRWKVCAKCQTRMRTERLQSEAQLQTYLNHRLDKFLASRGRRMIGWDEILEGGLTPGAAVMSWRGTEGGIAAATAGHDVVMSPTSHCYLDYAQARGPEEPEAIGGFLPLETVYGFDPLPAALSAAQQKHILGVQGNLWTEYIPTPQVAEYFTYPRAVALAEVAWSPAAQRDFADFQRRLRVHVCRLRLMEVNFRELDEDRKPSNSGG
jgi:hexosaminidase